MFGKLTLYHKQLQAISYCFSYWLAGCLAFFWFMAANVSYADSALQLSRDYPYWRGERANSTEISLSFESAARNVTVVCDRWPDGSDLRQFGLDAVRLSGAKTEQDKCIAVWRWIRRWTMYTDGNPPTERLHNPTQTRHRNGYIDDPLKVLNVYGAHWCDGLSRVQEAVWRAMGYRAEKLARASHSMVICKYMDYDDVQRWHWFDVSEGGFLFDHTGRRLMTSDEMSMDCYYWMAGWVYCQHLPWLTHRTELDFRIGEKLERIWDNWEKPYQNNIRRDHQTVPDWERGPYKVDYGNGRYVYAPDLNEPGWVSGLAEPLQGMAENVLQPAEALKPGLAVWSFQTPYIISDVEVELDFERKNAEDAVLIHLSLDDGQNWKKVWECPADLIGAKKLKVNICEKYKVTAKTKSPTDLNSPFGRYHYKLKLELVARGRPEDCRVKGIVLRTTVQQNFYSLPQLQPGKNKITVNGTLLAGTALKVTYVWDDPVGHNRRNVAVVEKTPYIYEIVAGGKKWEDCVSKSITIEAISASGEGNRTLVKEQPSQFKELPSMRPATETRKAGIVAARPAKDDLPSIDRLIKMIQDSQKVPLGKLNAAIRALNVYRDPNAFESVKKLALVCF